MIRKLTGRITSIDRNEVIVDVGGVGYGVGASTQTISQLQLDSITSLWIHHQVKENEMALFGFLTQEELQWFEALITVQGIGGKLALSMLSAVPPEAMSRAILTQDAALLKKINGVGPRLASRVINELGDKKILELQSSTSPSGSANRQQHTILNDATEVLISLGFAKVEALRIASLVMQNDPEISIENLVKKCLSNSSSSS